MAIPNKSERKEARLAPLNISPQYQAEIEEIKLEQALMRYRLMVQRGLAWSVYPTKQNKRNIR